MSVTGALFNALSGMTAASRGVEVVSTNIANAMTEGFARRELELGARALAGRGTGVTVNGVKRVVDMVVLGDLRLADGAVKGGDEKLKFYSRLEPYVGSTDSDFSLSRRIANLQSAFVEASSRPDSATRLTSVAEAARGVASSLNEASRQVQTARMDADREIGAAIGWLNGALGQVAELNHQIRLVVGSNQDAGGLVDQRQALIDQISAVVPVREVNRDHGQIALFTPGGAVLLDGRPAELGFIPVGVITADMTVEGGALSGLTLNGNPVAIDREGGPISGGRLAALFDIRDRLGTDAQERLDAVARDLVERFQDPAVDPTLAPGDAGLFTDAGSAFDVVNELGLAARLKLNPAVDPTAGGEVWRLRAGINAAAPNDAGDGSLLLALADVMASVRPAASGPFGAAGRSAGGLADELASLWNADRAGVETSVGFSSSRAQSLRLLHLQDGVDTDHEMQRLLTIEQAYAANARVITTVDELIQILLGF